MEPVAPSRRIGEGTDIYAARRVGRLSLDTVHDFISTMRAEPASLLVLDMAEVSFLDSAGVGAIVALFVGAAIVEKEWRLRAFRNTPWRYCKFPA